MKNYRTEMIKASATFIKKMARNINDDDVFSHISDHTRKIIRYANSHNKNLLNKYEISDLLYLIDSFRSHDGYFHDMSDEKLDNLETKLKLQDKEARVTDYDKKKRKNMLG
jgi:hypothetical protein